jgi:hypothetical protein
VDLESTSITEEDEAAPSLTSLRVVSVKTLPFRSLLELTATTLSEEGTEGTDPLCPPVKGLDELEMPALLCFTYKKKVKIFFRNNSSNYLL